MSTQTNKTPAFVESKIENPTTHISPDLLEAAKQQLLAEGYYAPANQQPLEPGTEAAASTNQDLVDFIKYQVVSQLKKEGWLSPDDPRLTKEGRAEKRRGKNGKPLNDEYELPTPQDMLTRLNNCEMITVSLTPPPEITNNPDFQSGKYAHYELFVHTGTYWYIPTGRPVVIPIPVYELGVASGKIPPMRNEDIILKPRVVRQGNHAEGPKVELEPQRVYGAYDPTAPKNSAPAWAEAALPGSRTERATAPVADVSEAMRGARVAPEPARK